MDKWIGAALDYIPRWLEYQMRLSEQPGCVIAIAYKGKLVLEQALGHADLSRGTTLTTRHRFRVASHSKSFTAAGVLKLREQGRLRLDDAIGRFVIGLHPKVASASISQLLSHTAGLIRDGFDAGQWSDRRAFLDEAELRADLAGGPTIDANTRLKYSNHGFGLIGLAIEAITGEPYTEWIAREIVEASKLRHTTPDAPIADDVPFARGHSGKLPLGHRLVIPGDNPTRALAAATGFISTAGDLARFFASLSPESKKSVLGVDSRREMWRRQWRDAHSSVERWYGLGTISGNITGTSGGNAGDWDGYGHSGGFQGTTTRTVCVPAKGLTISVLTNSSDGPSHVWLDGALHILRCFEQRGAPSRRVAGWAGRWWSLWGAIDLLPVDGKVLVVNPAFPNPVLDASEIEPVGRASGGTQKGLIVLSGAFGNHGETAQLRHDKAGRATEFWLGGTKLLREAKAAKELATRYGKVASPEP